MNKLIKIANQIDRFNEVNKEDLEYISKQLRLYHATKPLTMDDLITYFGDNNAMDYLLSILNNQHTIKLARQEIISYNEGD